MAWFENHDARFRETAVTTLFSETDVQIPGSAVRANLLAGASGVTRYETRYIGEVLAGVCRFDELRYQKRKEVRRGTRAGSSSRMTEAAEAAMIAPAPTPPARRWPRCSPAPGLWSRASWTTARRSRSASSRPRDSKPARRRSRCTKVRSRFPAAKAACEPKASSSRAPSPRRPRRRFSDYSPTGPGKPEYRRRPFRARRRGSMTTTGSAGRARFGFQDGGGRQ